MNQGSFSDFMSFRTLISTVWIKVVYAIGAIIITLGSIVLFLGAASQGVAGTGLVSGLLYFAGGNVFWRMLCEFVILFFSMHEQLVALVQQTGGQGATSLGAPVASAGPLASPVSSPALDAGVQGATIECRWCGERTSAVGKSCRFCGRPIHTGESAGTDSSRQSGESPCEGADAACPSCGAALPAGTIHHRCWKCDAPLR